MPAEPKTTTQIYETGYANLLGSIANMISTASLLLASAFFLSCFNEPYSYILMPPDGSVNEDKYNKTTTNDEKCSYSDDVNAMPK